MAALLIIFLVVATAAITTLITARVADVRRKSLMKARTVVALLATALADVDLAIDDYNDIESPLAARLRPIIRTARAERDEIEAS